MKTIRSNLLALAFISLAAAGAWAAPAAPLALVPELDLSRYLGRWYEVARYQHPFEKTLQGATAEYSLREDGRIRVLNSGFKKTLDGAYTDIEAVAWRPDASSDLRHSGIAASSARPASRNKSSISVPSNQASLP